MIAACPMYCKSPKLLLILATVGLIFGAATIFSGGQVIFGPEENRIAVGDYIPFVVWSNFVAGFAYIIAALGLFLRKKWAVYIAIGIVALTVATFAALGIHVLNGGAFEARTIAAMVLRAGVWMAIAWVARKNLL